MKVGDPVTILAGKYAGRNGTISYVYPCPLYLRVRLRRGLTIDRTTDGVRPVTKCEPQLCTEGEFWERMTVKTPKK